MQTQIARLLAATAHSLFGGQMTPAQVEPNIMVRQTADGEDDDALHFQKLIMILHCNFKYIR